MEAADLRPLLRIGGVCAIVFALGSLGDVVLAMTPGWGPASIPTGPAAWLEQLGEHPWLGVRNLDLLNVTLAALVLPLYVGLAVLLRRWEVYLGLAFLLIGTALFIGCNAALPMLDLGRQYAGASSDERLVLEAAAQALLARGAHGSLGVFPAFLLSELGTLLVCLGMRPGRPFGRVVPWLGVVGMTCLLAYTVAMTFVPGAEESMMALAAPGGLLMIAWHLAVGWRLVRDPRVGVR